MKVTLALTTSILSIATALPSTLEQRAQPKGCDVSGYQPNINWAQVKANGASFVFIKVRPPFPFPLLPKPHTFTNTSPHGRQPKAHPTKTHSSPHNTRARQTSV